MPHLVIYLIILASLGLITVILASLDRAEGAMARILDDEAPLPIDSSDLGQSSEAAK